MDKDNRPASSSDSQLQELAQKYLRRLPGACQKIESSWLKANIPDAPLDDFDNLLFQCHQLAGSANSYGLSDIASLLDRIADATQYLKDGGNLNETLEMADADKLVEELLTTATRITPDSLQQAVSAQKTAPGRNSAALIYIVDDDPDQGKRLALQLESHGLQTASFEHLDDAREAILIHAPDAIIADIVFPEGDSAGIEMIAALRDVQKKTLPVVFMSQRTDADARLQALRAGGSGYFTKPVDISAIAAKLHELVEDQASQPYRVLIVDDDATTNMLHSAILKRAGLRVSGVSKPLDALSAATDFQPELIFMDLYMPEVSGLEVAGLLRQEEAFLDVPIVFLSGEKDTDIQARAIREGAANFLNKPVPPDDLVEIARSRAQQFRARANKTRYARKIDPITGLYTREHLLSQYRKQQDVEEQSFLAVIAIDNFGAIRQSLGEDQSRLCRARIAQLVRSRLTSEDIAAAFSENQLLLVLRRSDNAAAESSLGKIHQLLTAKPLEMLDKPIQLSVSIGVSRGDQSKPDQSLAEAQLACVIAQNEGGNQIHYEAELQHESLDSQQQRRLRQSIKDAIKQRRLSLGYAPMVGVEVGAREQYTLKLKLFHADGQVIDEEQLARMANRFQIMGGLEQWTLRTAIRSLNMRQQQNPGTRFFVRISAETLVETNFAAWIARQLKKCPLETGTLVLSVTEEDIVTHTDALAHAMRGLRSLGCSLCIDHYGRLHDILDFQKLFIPGFIRLDRSFTTDIEETPSQLERIENTCNMAHRKGCKVLTAFAPNTQSLVQLWGIGVDYIQGEYYEQAEGFIER
ncbi:MAG: EAL domain-containing response regulator [bacterium]